MKATRVAILSMLSIGLFGCASYQERYYVPSDGRSGDYYYAPAPYDDGYRNYYGGYCPWGAFDCWSPYNSWYSFSFGYSYGPWWGSPFYYDPRYRHHDPRHWHDQAAPSQDFPPQDVTSSREPRSRDREPAMNERPMRAMRPAPEPSSRGQARQRRPGSPP